jgi:hypothetical protein
LGLVSGRRDSASSGRNGDVSRSFRFARPDNDCCVRRKRSEAT